LAGQRSHLSKLDLSSVAIHIDAHKLQEGKNITIIAEKDLLLPSYINMLDCNPRIVELIVEPSKGT
jgi:hypothetical protein